MKYFLAHSGSSVKTTFLSHNPETNDKQNPLYTNAVNFKWRPYFRLIHAIRNITKCMQTNPDHCFQKVQFLTYYRPKWLAREQALMRVWGWVRKEGKPQGSPRELIAGH